MKKVWFAVIGLAVVGFGCGPRLAQTPYGQKELEWKGYVEQAYPSWTPPKTVPPVKAAREQAGAPAEKVLIEQDKTVIQTPESSDPLAVEETTTIQVEPPAERTYTVVKNDSLWKIAKKIYGDGRKWQRIRDANKGVLGGNTKLKPGMVLAIPAP